MREAQTIFTRRTVFFLVLLLAGLGWGCVIAIRDWQDFRQETNLSFSITTPYECGVVLTGGPGRIREGVNLLQKQLIQKLIISGVSPNLEKKDLINKSDYQSQIFLEKRSRSTYGNAIYTTSEMVSLGCRNLVLITSSLHAYRAYRVFRTHLPLPFELARHTVGPVYDEATIVDLFWELSKTVVYGIWIYDH